MQNKILFERFTTLPNMRGHYRRTRIDKLLENLLEKQLITVTAGAGWGKTHAVSAFLQNVKARVIWFQLSELDNHPARFWEEFVYIIESENKDTANQLKMLGFPETLSQYDKFLHILAKEIYTGEQIIFAFDDFHLIHDNSVLNFVKNFIFANLENFCIIINTRVKVSFDLTNMISNDLVGRITAEDLSFTLCEIEDYLKQQGITLTERELKKIHNYTEGWPLAIYLINLSIKKGGIVSKDLIDGAIPLIFEMIEKGVFAQYDSLIQNFLIRVSLLNSFPEGLIKMLAGDLSNAVSDFISENNFINYNPYIGHYNFHHLFLEFLKCKQNNLTQNEITDTHLKAAKWCADNDLKIEALYYYDKCGCHDEILNVMFNFGVAVFSKSIANLYINLIEKFPTEFMKNNPLLYVHHAGLLYNNAEVDSAVNELLKVQKELEALPSEANKTVLGEIHCLLGLIYLGRANYDFVDRFKKAGEYLPNGSNMFANNSTLVNTRYAIMLNSPAHGELKKMEDAMFYAMPYASKLLHGYGQGFEHLAAAEAAYFIGDMKKAVKYAYETVYKAREGRAADVLSSGYFLLMRIEAANGNYKGVISNLKQLKIYAGNIDKWNFIGTPDVADGWLNLILGDKEKVANWLIDDALGNNTLAPFSIGMEKAIKARYLLKEYKYYELLAWIGQTEKMLRENNLLLILLEILICKSIASHQIQDEAQSFASLCDAYELAHGNNLIMQFVEYGKDIRAVIYSAKNSGQKIIPDKWLDEIYVKAATYDKHLRNMKEQHNSSGQKLKISPKLTKREKEMLVFLCQGLTNAEIAKASFITLSAVKKMLNNIYIKLNATNRTDAVRIALQMELYK